MNFNNNFLFNKPINIKLINLFYQIPTYIYINLDKIIENICKYFPNLIGFVLQNKKDVNIRIIAETYPDLKKLHINIFDGISDLFFF